MTRQDFAKKWIAYSLALILTAALQELVLTRLRPLGVIPVLLPLAMTALAALEGPVDGAAFGIAVGVMEMYLDGAGAWAILLCCLGGLITGLLAQYVLSQNFVGHVVCAVGALAIRGAWMVFVHWRAGAAALPVLLRLAGTEALWTVLFCPVVYLMFRFAYRRWGSFYYL